MRSGIPKVSDLLAMSDDDKAFIIAYWDTVDAVNAIELAEAKKQAEMDKAKFATRKH